MTRGPSGSRDTALSRSTEDVFQEFAPYPYQSLNEEAELLAVNDAWEDVLGYDRSDIEGEWFGTFLTEQSAARFGSSFPSFNSEGDVSRVELDLIHAEGHSITVSLDGRAEYDEDGRFRRTHCQFHDITHRKKRARELERHEAFVQNTADTIAVLDPGGTVTYVSPAVESVLGCNQNELLGGNFFEHVRPEHERRVRDALNRVCNDTPGSTVSVEYRFECQTCEGTSRWIESRLKNTLADPAIEGVLVTSRDVTHRKERQKEIQSLQERLKLAVEGANLGVWDLDMTAREVEYNERLANILGYSHEEIDSDLETWQERIHPEDRPDVSARIEAYLEGDIDSHDAEYRMRANKNDWRWVRDTGEIVERNDDGTPARLVGITFDIDDRKRAEIALEEERDMFADGPVVVFKWDNREGWPTEYVSENVTEVFGYLPGEFESGAVPFADIVHDEDLDRVKAEVRANSDESIERFSHEPYRVTTKDGDVRWVMDHTKNIREGDEITHRLGYLVDITERKRHEQKLRQFQEAVEQAALAVYITDTDGTIEYVNPAFEEITGYSADEAIGETASMLQSGEYDDAFYDDLWETVLSGQRWHNEMIDEREDGEHVVFDQTISPITDRDGEIEKFVAVAQDVTQRKEYEQQIEAQRDNLEILNQVVRHDIRNNLQLILAYGEMLDTHVDDEGTEYLEKVLSSSNQAVEITATARDVAQTLLQTDVECTPIRLRFTLERELEEVRSNYEDATVTVDGTIPNVDVMADDMLSSVFRNVLKNAIVHNDKRCPQVELSASTKENRVRVCIADNGPGISDGRKEEIFEKGEKGLDSEGTGLGLYLVNTLVDRYGGGVWIEDNDPEGAVFCIELPVDE